MFLQVTICLSILLFVLLLPYLLKLFALRRDPGGDVSQGLVIFVESTRWLSFPWGKSFFAFGLRKAGYKGEFLYWKWHAAWRAWLLLPVMTDRRHMEDRAQQLCEFIKSRRQQNPEIPIHLVGYSAGGYIALRSMELLSEDVEVDSAVLIAPSFSPQRDINPAFERIRGNIVMTSSILDVVVGLGTTIIGTCDRCHCPSAGCLGYRGPACSGLVQLRWKPSYIALGNFGGHFTAPAEGFTARCIAPLMGIGE